MKKIFTLLLLIFIDNTYTSAQELEWEKIDVPVHSLVWDICFTPSGEIYAGSKGIYRSDDSGQNWEADGGFEYNDTFFEFGDMPITIDNIFLSSRGYLFASFDYTNILRKAPGSKEWELHDLSNGMTIKNMSESTSGRLYNKYEDDLIYSDDNGDTWKTLTIEPWVTAYTITADEKIAIFTDEHDLLLFEESSDTLLQYEASKYPYLRLSEIYQINGRWIGTNVGNYKDLYVSHDSGKNWVHIDEISGLKGIITIHSGYNNSILIFTKNDGIYHGDSTFENWTNYKDPAVDIIFNVRFHNQKYYACTYSGVYQSTDEGKSWEHYVPGVMQIPRDVYVNDEKIFVSTTGGIYLKDHSTDKWLKTNTKTPFKSYMVESKFEYAHGKLYSRRDGNIMKYNPTLNLWEDIFEVEYVDIISFVKNDIDEIVISTVGDENPFIKITESGTEIIETVLENHYCFITYSNGLYIIKNYFSGDEYYYSLDEFETINSFNYTGIEEYNSEINSIVYKNGNIYTADEAGFIRFSTNLGETWSNKSTGITEYFQGIFGRSVPLQKILNIGNTLYVTSQYGAFRSTDMGENWIGMTNLPSTSIFNMRHAEDNHIYVTSGRGLYRTTEEVVSVDDNDLPKYNETSIIYPNPANDKITIEISDTFVPEKIEIVDLKGNKVYNKNIGVTTGCNTISLSIESIPQGVYIIRLVNQNETRTQILNIVR